MFPALGAIGTTHTDHPRILVSERRSAVESFTVSNLAIPECAASPLDVNRLDIRECVFRRGPDRERSQPGVLHASKWNVRLAGSPVVYMNHPGFDVLHKFVDQVPITREQ